MAEETPETEATATDEAPKKGGLIPMIGGVVGGLALGAVLGLFVLGPKLTAHAAPAKVEAKGEQKKPDGPPAIYQLDNLVVNPAGSGGAHFLLMSVAFELKDAGSVDVIKGREAEIRDAILRLFSSMTTEQVTDLPERDRMRAKLMQISNDVLHDQIVKKIYFPQFVVQ